MNDAAAPQEQSPCSHTRRVIQMLDPSPLTPAAGTLNDPSSTYSTKRSRTCYAAGLLQPFNLDGQHDVHVEVDIPVPEYSPTKLDQTVLMYSARVEVQQQGAANDDLGDSSSSGESSEYDSEESEYTENPPRRSTPTKRPRPSPPVGDHVDLTQVANKDTENTPQSTAPVPLVTSLNQQSPRSPSPPVQVLEGDPKQASRKRDPQSPARDEDQPPKDPRTLPPKTDDGRILGDASNCRSYLPSCPLVDAPACVVNRAPSVGKWFAIPEIGVHRGKLFEGTF